jgi:transposase
MGYKVGADKKQMSFMPVCLDDFIPQEHICRVIEAFTATLDMVSLGFKYAECKQTGNRPFDPRTLLNLYIYGYLHRVRSSRRLQAETTRNIEVMWLLDGLTPDDKTICNFRGDNAKQLREVFREFNRMCRNLGLFGGELAATDGTKIRANNSRKNNHNKTTVERELSRLEKKISEYMNELDKADGEESETALNPAQIKEALEKLKSRQKEYEDYKTRLDDGESEISTVDPDARLMRQGGDGRPLDVCYNVQTVVDEKRHLIADFEVIGRSDDKGNAEAMSNAAMETMGVSSLTNLMDKGYYDGADIEKCEHNGVTCLVAKSASGGAKADEGYSRDKFTYDKERDCYTCPCQNALKYMRQQKHSDGKEYGVYANYKACADCPNRSKCTKSKHRQILRSPHQDTMDVVDARTRANRELYRKRQEIVEHPFGTIKAVWGYRQFLCRSKPKVTAETALAYLAYNFRRVINIFKENGWNLAEAIRLSRVAFRGNWQNNKSFDKNRHFPKIRLRIIPVA